MVNICDVCTDIFAGGDAPKGRISSIRTEQYPIPIYSNGEDKAGLYGYTDTARVYAQSVTVSARGTIGYTAIRTEPFVPIVRLITLVPDQSKIDIKYLYYAVQNYEFEGSGTSIPQLTVPMLKKYNFPLPSKEEQQKVVSALDKVNELISLRKEQLGKLDQLVKSRFIELFGEPLSNKKGWKTMPLVKAAPIKSRRGDLADEIWLLNLDAVEAQTGTVLFKHRVQGEEINASTVYFTTENVLYSKLRPYLNKVVMPDEDGVATSEMIPMYPLADRLNRAYLCYWLRSDAFVKHISEKVAGAKMPRVSMDYFRSLSIELPPMELQEQFAAFVKQTDKSKLTIQQSLDKLELLKKSLMQEYFG